MKEPNGAHVAELIADLTLRSLKIVRDITHAPDAPTEKWNERRRKVVADANMPTYKAPFYLKAAIDFAGAAVRADAARSSAPRSLGIIIGVPVISKEDWLKLGETVDAETEAERRAIDAVVVEPEK